MSRRRRIANKNAAFTLAEVVITMFLMSLTCLGIFAGMQQITKAMMAVALRDEAYHLMQAEAERLLATDYTSFTATASDQSITGAAKTTYLPSTAAKFGITSDNALGRATFTRRVVQVSSTTTSRTLRVEVQWTWQGRSQTITTTLLRIQ